MRTASAPHRSAFLFMNVLLIELVVGFRQIPTDGKADLRMNTFTACGIELNTDNLRIRSLDKAPRFRNRSPVFASAVRVCHPWE
jgi:hypothetical protein